MLRRLLGRSRTSALAALSLLAPSGSSLEAQTPGDAWNSKRALELVALARSLRHETSVDPAFRSYSAEARGYVYYFLDRADTNERTLVKTDQIALEVYWRAPSDTRQRIVGLRDEKKLPTNIKYHLDHLTVVQDDFGDRIHLGDGDEVEAVIHPVAPASDSVYDFRLADSLTLTFPGPTAELRVYELQVRPKDLDAPGIIGSLFLERETGAIVRMNFTFTPASYVDSHLDYIRISLDNSVWDEKYWLPYRQEVEIRREVPLLEFVSGGVIRSRFDIRRYRFNPELPDGLFGAARVTAAANLEDFPFESGLYDQLDEEGLAPAPALDEIRRQAVRMVGRRYVTGLAPSRLYFPSLTSVVRYSRAEGYFNGMGLSLRPGGSLRLRSFGGYAFSRRKPHASVYLGTDEEQGGTHLRATWNDLRDVGPIKGASGVLNTLSALAGAEDFTDPYFASGVSAARSFPVPGGRLQIAGYWERHRSAEDVVNEDGSSSVRPVRRIDEGDGLWLQVDAIPRPAGRSSWLPSATLRLGRFEHRTFASALVSWEWMAAPPSSAFNVTADVHGGWVGTDAPAQMLFLLGGRHTLPGYDYRSFQGDRMALIRVEATRAILTPWFRLRLFGSSGVTGLERDRLPQDWTGETTDGLKSAIGAGVGLGFDILRLDAARGVNGGEWEFIFSVNHGFWRWL